MFPHHSASSRLIPSRTPQTGNKNHIFLPPFYCLLLYDSFIHVKMQYVLFLLKKIKNSVSMEAEGVRCGVLLDAITVRSELRRCACGSHRPPRREKVFWFAIEIQMTMAIQPSGAPPFHAQYSKPRPSPPPPQTPSPLPAADTITPPPSPPVLLVNERRPNEPRRSYWKHLLPVTAAGRRSLPASSPLTLLSLDTTRHRSTVRLLVVR